MTRLLIHGARVVTLAGPDGARRGEAMNELSVLPLADVLIDEGIIVEVTDRSDSDSDFSNAEELINADGRVLMPAFADCHTHSCWAGNRLDEWVSKQQGASYLEILKAGGGIMSTVRAVRQATQAQLCDLLLERLDLMLTGGTTSVEIKSGYGLSLVDELKMLRAIEDAQANWPGRIVLTACLGHALDPEIDPERFVTETIGKTLPAVTSEFPGIAIDAYCEEGAWSVNQCLQLFDAAATAGHKLRVHADQFNSLGMVEAAIQRKFISVDHLEASDRQLLINLATSLTFGVMLPACGFHMDDRYADGRTFVDAGGALALATNYNPGSAPCYSMPMVTSLAVRQMKLTPAETITATTTNPARLLGLHDRGTIEAGQRADLILLRHTDERMLSFEFGDSPIDTVICGGELV